MTGREPPPQRRASYTSKVYYEGNGYHVTVGFHPDGRVAEVFAHGAQIGSFMDRIIDDACIVMSILLQHGVEVKKLLGHLGRMPTGEPGSVLGMLLEVARKEEKIRDGEILFEEDERG